MKGDVEITPLHLNMSVGGMGRGRTGEMGRGTLAGGRERQRFH